MQRFYLSKQSWIFTTVWTNRAEILFDVEEFKIIILLIFKASPGWKMIDYTHQENKLMNVSAEKC